jgi:ferredoxin
MTVLQGFDVLAPPSVREATTLARNDAGRDQRLGCQCKMPSPAATVLVTTGYW